MTIEEQKIALLVHRIKDNCYEVAENLLKEHDKQIRADAIEEIERAMYHQCFECNNDENMQKWDSGNWFRYKLFEKVVEQLKEQNEQNGIIEALKPKGCADMPKNIVCNCTEEQE